MDQGVKLELDDVLAELSERGRLEWQLAEQRATNKQLTALLKAAQQPDVSDTEGRPTP